MLPTHNVVVPLGRKHVATFLGALVALNLIILLVMYLHRTGTLGTAWWVDFIAGEFNLSGENNLSVWYSSMLLLLVSLGAFGCFAVELQHRPQRWDRLLSYGWALFALLFLGLSLDELGSIHERIPTLPGLYSPVEALQGWVGVLIVPIAVVGLFMLAFATLRVRQSPAAFGLMLLGLLLFLSIPAQEHLEIAARRASDSPEAWRRPAGLAVLEEGTEVFASLCFFASTLLYLRMLVRRFSGAVDKPAAEEQAYFAVPPRIGVAAAAVLAIGFIFIEFGLLRYTATSGSWGHPRNWFASTLAFGAMLIALELGRGARRAPQTWAASRFLFLALLCLVVSADHGNAHEFTQRLWTSQPTRNFLVNAVYAMVVLFSAAALAGQPLPRRIRWLIGGWAVLLAACILTRSALLAPLSFVAFAVLIPTLLHALPVVRQSHSTTAVPSRNSATAGATLNGVAEATADVASRTFPLQPRA